MLIGKIVKGETFVGTIRKLDDNVNIIGTNLKRIREEHGLSQYDLCCKLELLGVTMYKADIYEIENNKRLVKDFESKALCIALGVTLDELYSDTDKYFEH